MSVRRWCATVVVAAPVVLLAGCGDPSADEVTETVAGFTGPGRDAADRCALLTPTVVAALEEDSSTTCDLAIDDVPVGDGDVRSVEVWGEEAQARLTDDTLFLTRTADGWRITAAACRPQAEGQPYACALEGS